MPDIADVLRGRTRTPGNDQQDMGGLPVLDQPVYVVIPHPDGQDARTVVEQWVAAQAGRYAAATTEPPGQGSVGRHHVVVEFPAGLGRDRCPLRMLKAAPR